MNIYIYIQTYTYEFAHLLLPQRDRAHGHLGDGARGGVCGCDSGGRPRDLRQDQQVTHTNTQQEQRGMMVTASQTPCRAAAVRAVESSVGISQIWFCAAFSRWGVHKFGVMVRFTYG